MGEKKQFLWEPVKSCSQSMDADGTKNGYDISLTRAVSEAVNVPVIASGGAGKLEHFTKY